MASSSRAAAYAAAVPPPGERPHSIAVFGCTGNAGRAVAYHVIKSAAARDPSDGFVFRVALSGRNRDKVQRVLNGVLDELRDEGANADGVDVSIVVADASDDGSMLDLAQSSSVLVSCAGPFGRYGEAAIRACVECGTHYVDITGEVPWVTRMIGEYGARAEGAGVALCPFAGYDCVPAELGMWLVGGALGSVGGGDDNGGATLGGLELNFRSKGGGFPHGTLETILDTLEGKAPKRREGDPYFYPKEYRGAANAALSVSSFVLPKYQLGQFTGPNFMSVINVPVLCRAAPALGFSSELSISDKSVMSGRPSLLNGYGLFPVQAYITALIVGGLVLALPPFRWLLRGRLKTYSCGGDPSGKVFLDARGTSANGGPSATARCVFPGDPGIYATGLFAAGVANALHEATAPGSKHPMPLAGFNSPLAALHGCREGLLVDHLRAAGCTIKVEVGEEGKVREVDAAKLRSKL